MNRTKPKVGDDLFSLNVGNAAWRCKQELTPVRVMRVGRKYFYTGMGYRERAYEIDGWRQKSDLTATSHLYATEQEWLDDCECLDLSKKIGVFFELGRRGRDLTLDKLRRIMAIIDDDSMESEQPSD